MIRLVIISVSLISLFSCEKEKPEANISKCADPRFTRTELVGNVPAVIIAQKANGQPTGSYTIQSLPISSASQSPVPWSPCNLDQQFQVDTLKIRVSGYLLTYPGLELKNISTLPFEITDIKRAQ